MFRKIFSVICLISMCLMLFTSVTVAADVEYTTEGCTWSKINDTTYVTDTDGDGNYDITLVRNGNEWTYYFVV